ncbi:hypothetical protein EXIGLDRAFT_459769 [Exidia glandulosa HHB12029]|uniref:Uncharacterized protein n=1 Tax=Exidia glandulosa HHB12029 TaxID=1314781 RepID=A0A165K5A2_EXIGL|nr:hypothetical protein EXIGLDRAFT_459769 [Exidia glandulosa HHB12029]
MFCQRVLHRISDLFPGSTVVAPSFQRITPQRPHPRSLRPLPAYISPIPTSPFLPQQQPTHTHIVVVCLECLLMYPLCNKSPTHGRSFPL